MTNGSIALSLSAVAIEPEEIGNQVISAYDPEQEYFLGAGMSYGVGAQRFPSEKTDRCNHVTFETLRQMLNDPEVSSDVRTLRDMVLSDGIEILPAFQGDAVPDDSPEFVRAQEIAEHCKRSLQSLSKPLKTTLEGLIEGALNYGHKTAEITWQMGTDLDAGKLILRRIALKDYRSLNFVLDSFSNHLGFTPRSASIASTVTIIPREKFLHLALNEEDEDPRGRSSTRPAYTAWQFKLSAWPEYYRWLQTAALPGLIGRLAPKQPGDVQRNADGTVKSGGRQLSPAEAMAGALEAMKSAGVAVIPNGSEVDQLEASGEGQGFDAAIKLSDAQMGKAVLRQTLATGEAQFGTRAQSQTHLNVLDMVVWNLRGHLARLLQKDIVRQMIRYNFGEEALPYMPIVSLGDSERRDWSKDAMAAAALEGSLTDSQWLAVTTQLGIPAPLPGEKPRNHAIAEQMEPRGLPIEGDKRDDGSRARFLGRPVSAAKRFLRRAA